MPDVKYRVVTSASQLPPPPPLRSEVVVLTELPADAEGYHPAVCQCELNTGEHDEYLISNQVFDESGQTVRFKTTPGRNIRLLAYTTRDGDGNRLWPTVDAAAAQLNQWGQSTIQKLLVAANRVNYEEAPSSEEAEKRAEGNSAETPSSN